MVLTIASLYFGLLAFGCFAPLPLVKLKEVGIGFYRFFGFSCMVLWALSFTFYCYGQNSTWFFFEPEKWHWNFQKSTFTGLSIGLSLLATLGFTGALRLRLPWLLWICYGIAVLSGFAATCFLPWYQVASRINLHTLEVKPLWPFLLNALSSGLVMGFVTLAMMLGHWYLVTPKLSITPLKRFAGGYILLILWKIVSLTFFFFFFHKGPGLFLNWHLSMDTVFLLFRVTWGLLAPLGFSYWIWKTVKMKSTQSATGILYAAMVCTLMGEAIGLYLTLDAGVHH